MSTTAQIDQQIETLVQSPAFRDWQAQLTACFYDRERKDALIRQVREAITGPETGFTAADHEALRRAVIGRLVGLASQDARRPPADDEPPVPERSPQELADLIIEQFPHPIAVCYRHLDEAAEGAGAFGCLLDTFESLLHYLATVVLSAYWRDGAPDPMHNRRLLEKFYKGKWATGDLMELLRETARRYLSRPEALPYPALVRYLFKPDGRPSPSLLVLEGFVEVRNKVWGHGAGRDNRFFAGIFPGNHQKLAAELNRCAWLTTHGLWLPKAVDDHGHVTVVDVLNGERRRKDRPVSLQLDPTDLDIHGGDVVPERTLLVVDAQTKVALPLFPLSLFHFQRRGQGLFFLNDLDWADQAVRLKKARYLAYDSQLEPYEVRGGEPATALLEARMRQIEQAMEQQGIAVRQTTAAVREQPDYDLPEVWVEQASHLSTFVSREVWLARLRAWADTTAEGGYFLVLGPPGQGKSALLAQFAREMSRAPNGTVAVDGADHQHSPASAPGCLLHMVKSHKNPRRFLQFLLWQAERALGTPLGDAAYQGDVDDLRNALVGALEQVRSQRQQVLVVIDALDELDPSGERVRFLPESLPAGVRMVLSCRPDIPLVSALRRRLQYLTVADLPPLSAVDLPLFLERYMRRDEEPMRLGTLQDMVDFDALFQHTGGNPLFLKRAMELIREQVTRTQAHAAPVSVIDVTAFPNTVEAVFEDIYTQITEKADGRFTSDAGRLKARLLQRLAVVCQALSADELRGVLGVEGIRLSLEEARDLVLHMSQYLLTYDGERFVPFHQGLTDYLQHHILGDDGVAEAHRVFCFWLSTPPQRGSEYRLRHLPTHLLEWGKRSATHGTEDEARQAFEGLSALLTDFDFVQAKVQAGMTFDLVRDYHTVLAAAAQHAPLRSPTLESWARFLDADSHILSHFPHLYCQQALNQPADSPVSQAAETCLVRSPTRRPYLRWLNKPHTAVRSPLLRTLVGWVSAMTITADGRYIVSAGDRVWELASGQEVATLTVDRRVVIAMGDRRLVVSAIAMTTDGHYIVLGYKDGTLKVCERASRQEVATLQGHRREITAIAMTADGRYVVSGEEYGPLRVWERISGREVTCWNAHVSAVTALAVTANGRYIISGGDDGTLRVWERTSGREVTCWNAHVFAVTALAVTANGRYIISGGEDRALRVWKRTSGQEVAILRGHTQEITAVAVTPDGRHIVSGGEDETLRVWEWPRGQKVASRQWHTREVTAVAVTPDGRYVVSGGRDGILRRRKQASRREVASRQWHTREVTAVAVTPDGRYVVSGGRDGTLQAWERAEMELGVTLMHRMEWVTAVAVTADGRHIVSGGHHGTLRVWERASGQEVATLTGYNVVGWGTAVAVTADGRYVISSGESFGTLRVWEWASGQKVTTLRGHNGGAWVSAVAVTADGRYIISGDRGGTLRVWKRASGQEVVALQGHRREVTAVAVTADGRYIISGDPDGILKIWELASGHEVTMFTIAGRVMTCATSHDRRIVCGDSLGQVYIFRLDGV